jgi:hypothetical protein
VFTRTRFIDMTQLHQISDVSETPRTLPAPDRQHKVKVKGKGQNKALHLPHSHTPSA